MLGLGGIGKTLLTARIARDIAPHFDFVYCRSLRDAPAHADLLNEILELLAPDETPASSEAGQATRLLDVLRRTRCLLVFDNFETVLPRGDGSVGRTGLGDGYGTLIRQLGEVPHQSCLLLTSRDAPSELGPLRGVSSPVRVLDLAGFDVEAGRALLSDKRLDGSAEEWQALVTGCGGNGLALKVSGETIRDLFGGSIAAFLDYASSTPGIMIGGLRQLLDAQIDRLTETERELLQWLAVEREPVSFAQLAAGFRPRAGQGATLASVEGLRRRSLLERGEQRHGTWP